jgi:hypothetical protein
MRIQHSYLVWVGADNYETISEYVDEVRRLGVSKRLPGIGMANALSEAGSIVYVAHDDGEAYSCDACMGQVECSECRTWSQKIAKWQGEADAVLKRYADEDETPRGKARIVEIRQARIAKARAAMAECELCEGEGTFECGTGGYIVRKDGSRMDYRTFNYWMRQPHKFDVAREVTEKHMCEECGGTGKRPAAVVFGAFVPAIEVVLTGRENEIVQEQIERFAHISAADAAKEPERKGGHREPGYYAVAKAGKPSKRASAYAKELVTRRVVKGEPEVIGDFVLFPKPVKVGELKRFRGVKRFGLFEADERAEMSA